MPVRWCIYSLKMFMLKLLVGVFKHLSYSTVFEMRILKCYVLEKHWLKAEEQVNSVKNIA